MQLQAAGLRNVNLFEYREDSAEENGNSDLLCSKLEMCSNIKGVVNTVISDFGNLHPQIHDLHLHEFPCFPLLLIMSFIVAYILYNIFVPDV